MVVSFGDKEKSVGGASWTKKNGIERRSQLRGGEEERLSSHNAIKRKESNPNNNIFYITSKSN